MQLYPLKFKTIFKDKIWGGNKIKTVLNKDFSPLPNCGETWELSGVKGDVSIVENGTEKGKSLTDLIKEYKHDLVGEQVYNHFKDEFPLLIKFIDAAEDLSVQVHPDDELAKKRHNSFGKSEMWYVLAADEGASLISGFNQTINKETYLEKLNSGKLYDVLNKEEVKAGDIFYLPAGRIHTIGKGLLIAEIQQTSDITYRIYDFDRVDDKGNKRELHTEESIDALDYHFHHDYKTAYPHQKNNIVKAVETPFFITNVLDYDKETVRNYGQLSSFVAHVCVKGDYEIKGDFETVAVKKGDCVLIPAALKNITLSTKTAFKILETYIPQD